MIPGNKLGKIAVLIFSLSVIIQLLFVIWIEVVQISDFATYQNYATNVVEHNTWYPSIESIYTNYIFAPGLVNYFALLILIFKSAKAILFFNVLLNLILAMEIFYIARKFFGETVSYIFLLLFSLYPTTYGIVLYSASELPFMVLSFGAIVALLQKKTKYIVLAGILVGLANWIRPFLPVMILVGVYICWQITERGRRVKSFLVYMVSTILIIVSIGMFTYSRIGYFNYQSTTSGYNLIMGANDDADGSYDNTVFKEGNIGHISNWDSLTFGQRDVFWRNQAIDWIKENPAKWILLIPYKAINLFLLDLYALTPFSGDMSNEVESKAYLLSMFKNFPNWKFINWLMVYNQLFYYTILVLSLIGISKSVRVRNKVAISLNIFLFFMIAITLAVVGGGRYHYPMMPLLILFAAYYISLKINKSNFPEMTVRSQR